MVPWGNHEVRAVTHYGIERAHVDHVIDAVGRVLRAMAPVALAS